MGGGCFQNRDEQGIWFEDTGDIAIGTIFFLERVDGVCVCVCAERVGMSVATYFQLGVHYECISKTLSFRFSNSRDTGCVFLLDGKVVWVSFGA